MGRKRSTGNPAGLAAGMHEAEEAAGAAASPLSSFLWPLMAAVSASDAAASAFKDMAHAWAGAPRERAEPAAEWASPNTVALTLPSMRLRDFSAGAAGPPTLICAPYALHEATVADFARGHSIVEALRGAGLARLLVTEWRSATPDMQQFRIDTYLADLNVAVDDIGPPVDLIGLCQGGWMALLYAARFPHKVRRLVLAGAPVDVAADPSQLSRTVAEVPLAAFEAVVRFGDGRVLGERVLEFWAPALAAGAAERILQVPPDPASSRWRDLKSRFDRWYRRTVDLPGAYYLEVVRRLFKENQIARSRFVALGRRIALAELRMPLFLLAARDDELVPPGQVLAVADLVGTPGGQIAQVTEPCGHLGLFLGARTLAGTWQRIARWLRADLGEGAEENPAPVI